MNRDLSTLPIFSSRGEERTPLFFLQSRIIFKIFTHRNSSISISPNSRFNIFFLLLFEGEIPIVNLRKQPCTSIPITRYLLDRYNAPICSRNLSFQQRGSESNFFRLYRLSIFYIFIFVAFLFSILEEKKKQRCFARCFHRCSTFLRGEKRKRKEIRIIIIIIL